MGKFFGVGISPSFNSKQKLLTFTSRGCKQLRLECKKMKENLMKDDANAKLIASSLSPPSTLLPLIGCVYFSSMTAYSCKKNLPPFLYFFFK